MMDNFKELLDKRPKNVLYYSFFNDSNFVIDNIKIKRNDVIGVKELGNWAFNRSMNAYIDMKEGQKTDKSVQFLSTTGTIYMEWKIIAEICLGKPIYLKTLKKYYKDHYKEAKKNE